MKKILTCIIALVLLTNVVACGKFSLKDKPETKPATVQNEEDPQKEQNSEPDVKEEQADEKELKNEADKEQTPENSEEKSDEPEVIKKAGYSLYSTSRSVSRFDDDGEIQFFDGKCQLLDLDEADKTAYPNLYNAIKDYNDRIFGPFEANIDWYVENAKTDYYDYPDSYLGMYYNYTTCKPVRADEKVLSLEVDTSYYSGGIHGMYGAEGITYDVESGKEITTTDVVKDFSRLPIALTQILTDKYGDIFLVDVEETLFEREPQQFLWTLGNDGVTFYFNPYDLASFADGILTAFVDFDYMDGLLNTEYRAENGPHIESFKANNVSIDLDGDKKADDVRAYSVYESVDGGVEYVDVSINGKSEELAVNAKECEFYAVTPGDGKYYLYIAAKNEDNTGALYVYELAAGGAKEVGKLADASLFMPHEGEMGIRLLTDASNIEIWSSDGKYKYYHVGNGGMPEENQ